MKVRFNGRDCGDVLPIGAGERGILLGDGAFETILSLNGCPVWLSSHIDRLMAAVSLMGLEAVRTELEGEVCAVVGPEPGVIRLSVMRGEAPRGLAADGIRIKSTVLASFSPLSAATIHLPVRLLVSSVRRNEGSPSSRIKTLSYADNILAEREAVSRGADGALMLNNAGRVASAGIGNIFILQGRKLITPPVSEGVLAGIARGHVMDCASRLGLEPVETPLPVEWLAAADAVFMTNSLRLLSPVTELDGAALKFSAGTDGIFTVLCENIAAETGCDPRNL